MVKASNAAKIAQLLQERKHARRMRNLLLSDELRRQLEKLGVNVVRRDKIDSVLRRKKG